jgi:hypothetical protein
MQKAMKTAISEYQARRAAFAPEHQIPVRQLLRASNWDTGIDNGATPSCINTKSQCPNCSVHQIYGVTRTRHEHARTLVVFRSVLYRKPVATSRHSHHSSHILVGSKTSPPVLWYRTAGQPTRVKCRSSAPRPVLSGSNPLPHEIL